MRTGEGLTYRLAGVDIDRGNESVRLIRPLVEKTFRPEVIGGLGGFASLFALDVGRYTKPVLVAGTDGVGTKLAVAHKAGRHNTIGIDCVAMCVNDILAVGAEPLFFLDYLAVGKLEPEQVAEIVSGIAAGCSQGGCALVGGETAEMPGFYKPGEYDVAGFAVGIADRDKLADGEDIVPGDLLIGLHSNGLHSNGYSLARKIFFDLMGWETETYVPELGLTLGEELLKPTRIYVQPVLELLRNYHIKGMAHITGGGLVENPPRILPEGVHIEIEYGSWPIPPIFRLLAEKGRVETMEMLRTFNMGIGFVLIASPDESKAFLKELDDRGEKYSIIGRVTKGEPGVSFRGV